MKMLTTEPGRQDEFPYLVHETIELPFVAWFQSKKDADEMKRFAKILEKKLKGHARKLIAEKIKTMGEKQ